MSKLSLRSFLHSLGVAVYVAALSLIFTNGEKIFGGVKSSFGPAAFLMLFVLSAAITGSLVLGYPILLYLDNKKSEAVRMLFYTIGWLFFLTVLLFTAIVWLKI